MLGNRKIAIIGAGYVGASIAYALTIKNLAKEIFLIDIDKKKAIGEAMDIQHGIPYMGISSVYAGDYSDCKDCDLIIITAGRNRKMGESRLDMIKDNSIIMKNVIDNIKKYYTQGVILVISNPVDILTYLCDKWMNLPNGVVFGTGCLLDTSRTVRLVADYVELNTETIRGYVVGEHGDSQITLWSNFSVGGSKIDEYCKAINLNWNENEKIRISKDVKKLGSTIIENKGRTHYGIATCVCSIADAILNQHPTIASVTSPLQGEYGVNDISLSVPSIIGANGVERRIEEKWSKEELILFKKSADELKKFLADIR
ncbi:MAG: L-lactate dehydrogenase [Erysipelotrichaceae bacterium]|nr:L-lactate dehydrogenase [Erysipelotrichaceae bacterium]